MDTFAALLRGVFFRIRAGVRRHAVRVHVGAEGRGLVRGHDAEQRAVGGPEEHRAAASGDRPAAEGDHHEPEGDHPRADGQAEPLRGRAGGRRSGAESRRTQEGAGQEHHGGRVQNSRGHAGATRAHFSHAKTEAGEPGGTLIRLLDDLEQRTQTVYARACTLKRSLVCSFWGSLCRCRHKTGGYTLWNPFRTLFIAIQGTSEEPFFPPKAT